MIPSGTRNPRWPLPKSIDVLVDASTRVRRGPARERLTDTGDGSADGCNDPPRIAGASVNSGARHPDGRSRPGAVSSGSTALFLLALTLTALLLGWLGIHGFPHFTTDAVPFKQAAKMFINTGVFSRPSFQQLPHTLLVMGDYPQGYVYANILAFKALGY